MIPQYVQIQSTEHGHQTKEQIKTMQCRTLNRLYVNLNTDFKDAQILNLYIFSIIIALPVKRWDNTELARSIINMTNKSPYLLLLWIILNSFKEASVMSQLSMIRLCNIENIEGLMTKPLLLLVFQVRDKKFARWGNSKEKGWRNVFSFHVRQLGSGLKATSGQSWPLINVNASM